MSGLLGEGEGGAQRICWPPSKLLGDLPPPPPPSVPTPMLILSFKEESDISSLNGHVEMTTNTVIRLWTPMLILSFKEESDISSLNGHVEMTTNTVIRLWMHRLVRTCAFGVDARVKADYFHDLS